MPAVSDPRPAEVGTLTLPRIEAIRGDNKNVWKAQTYKYFAERLKRKNPDASLTKHIVDAAFHTASMRVARGRKVDPDYDNAIARVRHDASCASNIHFAND